MRRGLNGNQIKLIAIAAMTLQHVSWMIWPGYDLHWWVILTQVIGRITAPIMWFFIVEGYHHTKNLRNYILRLFLFAVISHFAYTFALNIPFVPFSTGIFNQTSVIWSLFCGLLALVVIDSPSLPRFGKVLLIIALCAVSFPADWSCVATIAIVGMGMYYRNFKKQMIWMMLVAVVYSIVFFFVSDRLYGVLQLCIVLSIPLLKCYNGERGRWKGMKWFFYIYYPAHLILCGFLRIAIWGPGINIMTGGQ